MPVFLFTEYKSDVILPEKGKEYPWQMPWILVNKADSKMHVFSDFHNEWKADSGRDDKNVKMIVNKQDDNTLHF